MRNSNPILLLASLLSFGVAVFQAVISFVPEWSAAFDAGDELVSNPPLLLVSGLAMALVFVGFGLYGLSGAGLLRRLPLLRVGLVGIGLVFTLRGIAFVPQLLVVLGILPDPQSIPLTHLLASLAALLVGLHYLSGLVYGWKLLCAQQPRDAPAHKG
jgi:putative oxidoreductase